MSAEQGLAAAQYNLGVCFFRGHGVAMNVSFAAHWFHKAAEQGNENARTVLALMDQ